MTTSQTFDWTIPDHDPHCSCTDCLIELEARIAAATTTTFCDLPDDTRMAFIEALDALGAGQWDYTGDCIRVELPRGGVAAIDALAARFGLVAHDHGWLFPLGSYQPAEHLRWDGQYPGSKGFTFSKYYRPAGPEPDTTEHAFVADDAQPVYCAQCGASETDHRS